MKKLKLNDASHYLDVVLEDDDTPNGGVSFVGETLGDFLLDIGLSMNSPMAQVNNALVECGIKPIDRSIC